MKKEQRIILLFCTVMMLCVIMDMSILYALFFGLILFLAYGKGRGFSWLELMKMIVSGIKSVKTILIVFVLIGMLTASWRMSGTIAVLVEYASRLIHPSTFLCMSFLLNCIVSVLTGTALGTAATMGVVCMTMATTMDVNTLFVGGAVMAGAYFGDRCSPVSTSAILVAEITHTNLFNNIKQMYRTAFFPFLLTCIIYLAMGAGMHAAKIPMDVGALFAEEFQMKWVVLLPAVLIVILSTCRVNVKINMAISIGAAILLSIIIQGASVNDVLQTLCIGYHSDNTLIGKMVNGGGIISMVRVGLIVCVSASYAGIFEKTGLLEGIRLAVYRCSERITPFGSILLSAIVTVMITCNQTLSIMLTNQLCGELEKDKQNFAIMLENSSVVVAPLIPWSVAAVVPLTAISATKESLLFAVFLYALPIWTFAAHRLQRPSTKKRYLH